MTLADRLVIFLIVPYSILRHNQKNTTACMQLFKPHISSREFHGGGEA